MDLANHRCVNPSCPNQISPLAARGPGHEVACGLCGTVQRWKGATWSRPLPRYGYRPHATARTRV